MAGHDSTAVGERDFVLVAGLRETGSTLRGWAAEPRSTLTPWFLTSAAIALGLLVSVWVVSLLSTPDSTPYFIGGVTAPGDLDQYLHVLGNNFLVLALHATACVAGFIAGSSLPAAASGMSGLNRFVHEKAGPLAIAWVVLVTTFSLFAQAFALGFDAASIAAQFGISSGVLILTVLPHALLELTAVFLPLAAWLIASRREGWQELLAATFVTVGLAIPMLLLAGLVEYFLWPDLLAAVSDRIA